MSAEVCAHMLVQQMYFRRFSKLQVTLANFSRVALWGPRERFGAILETGRCSAYMASLRIVSTFSPFPFPFSILFYFIFCFLDFSLNSEYPAYVVDGGRLFQALPCFSTLALKLRLCDALPTYLKPIVPFYPVSNLNGASQLKPNSRSLDRYRTPLMPTLTRLPSEIYHRFVLN